MDKKVYVFKFKIIGSKKIYSLALDTFDLEKAKELVLIACNIPNADIYYWEMQEYTLEKVINY